jgi:hypothetical protein
MISGCGGGSVARSRSTIRAPGWSAAIRPMISRASRRLHELGRGLTRICRIVFIGGEVAAEAKRAGEEALPIIETAREDVVEPGIQHQPAATERAPLGRDGLDEPGADAAAALPFRRHQTVEIEKPAVGQVLLSAVAGERDGHAVAPRREQAIAGRSLAGDPRRQFRGTREMRAQLCHTPDVKQRPVPSVA